MKFIAGAAAGILTVAGLTFAGAPAVNAAPNYGGKAEATCAVAVVVKNGKRVIIKPRIRVQGEGQIKGVKVLKLKKGNKKKAFAKAKLGKNKKRVSIKLPKKGKRFTLNFRGKKTGKAYTGCKTTIKFRR